MIVDPNIVSFSSLIVNYDLYAKWFIIATLISFFFVYKQTNMGNINMNFHGSNVVNFIIFD